MAFCMLLASGCRKVPETALPAEAGYVGLLSVIEIGDALFEIDELVAGYALDAVSGRLDLYMYDVSFSSKMPVTLNVMQLPDVSYTKNGSTLQISDTGIIPMMEVRGEMVPYERYLCTDLTGTITPEMMVLSMKLGGFQTDYSGKYTE
ncbi:MAG: hypothetical protein IJU34_03880 [Bacteroidales bacterium]|nr:hypothetical protein [Bacteroidales bacterium]